MPEPLTAGHIFEGPASIPSVHRPERDIWPIDLPGAQVKARRTAHSGSGTRWCATCNTTLEADGKAKFCDSCTLRRNSERRAANRTQTYAISAPTLRRLHDQAHVLNTRTNHYLDHRETMDRTEVVLTIGQVTEALKILISTIHGLPNPDRRR